MADFTQIIQEINDDINTNGVGAITGAKLNEVLRDMIAAVNAAKTDILPDGAKVTLQIVPHKVNVFDAASRNTLIREEA